MNIPEILELDTEGYKISSISKSKIIRVGEIKESTAGHYQFLTLEDNDGFTIRVKLKCESLLLKDEDSDREFVSFMAGPPVNKVPQGITFNKEKEIIIITKGAIASYSSQSEKEKEEVQIQLTEKEYKKPAEEITVHEAHEYVDGPSDHIFRECFQERLHILNILKKENELYGSPFSTESLYPMVTSLYIDCSRAKEPILPVKRSKPKFDSFDKPNNPKQIEDVKKKIDPTEGILSRISKEKHSPYFQVSNFNGKGVVGDTFLDNEKRPKAIGWMFSNNVDDLSGKKKESHEGIELLIRSLAPGTASYILMESMVFNYASLNAIEFDPTDIDQIEAIENKVNKLMEEKIGQNTLNSWQYTKAYFNIPKEERIE